MPVLNILDTCSHTVPCIPHSLGRSKGGGMNLGSTWHVFAVPQMLWTDPNKILNTSATLLVVFLIFLSTSSFNFSTSSSVLPVDVHPEHSESSIEVILLLNLKSRTEICSSPYLLSKSYFQHFECFHRICPKFKASLMHKHTIFSVLPFSRCTKITNGTQQTFA